MTGIAIIDELTNSLGSWNDNSTNSTGVDVVVKSTTPKKPDYTPLFIIAAMAALFYFASKK